MLDWDKHAQEAADLMNFGSQGAGFEIEIADPAVWKRIHDGLADASRGMSANPATQARSSIREYHSYARATWYCRSRFTGERDPWVG